MAVAVEVLEEEVAGRGAGHVVVGAGAVLLDGGRVEGVDLRLVLDDVVHAVALVGAQRQAVVADLVVLPAGALRAGIGGAGADVHGLVPVGGGGGRSGEEPVAADHLLVAEGEFQTRVADRSEVGRDAGEAGGRADGLVEDQVARVADVVVHREGEAVAQHRQVKTEVGLHGGLPVETLVDLAGLHDADQADVVTHRVEVVERGAGAHLRHGSRGADVGVAGGAPAGAQLQHVEQAELLDEGLAAEVPGGREGREGAPAVPAAEVGGTVAADRRGEHVFAVVGVVETREVGGVPGLDVGTAAALVVVFVVGGEEAAQEREREVLGGGVVPGAVGHAGGLADHGREVVLAERAVVGEVVLGAHRRAGGTVRAEGIHGLVAVELLPVVVGAHEGRRIAPAVGSGEVVFEVGPEDQARGQGDLGPESVADGTAVAVPVLAEGGLELVGVGVAGVHAAGQLDVLVEHIVAESAVFVDDRHVHELVGLAVDVVHRRDEAGVVDHVAAALAFGGVEVDGQTDLEPLGDVKIGAEAQEEALLPGVDDDALVVHVADGEVGAGVLGTARHGDVVLLTDGGLRHHVLPVDLVELVVIAAGEGGEGRTAVGLDGLPVHGQPVGQGGHFEPGSEGGDTDGGVEVHAGLAGLALAGGHEDDAVGTVGAVDGGRGGVLEDLDALDILRVEPAQVGGRAVVDAIHDPERVGVAVDRGDTADADVVAAGRVAAGLGDHDAGCGALEALGDGDRRALVHRLGVDGSDRSGHVAFLLGTVTDDHGLFQEELVLFKDEVEACLAAGELLLDLAVADAGRDDDRVVRDGQGIGAGGVGRGADGRALDEHAGGHDRVSVGVFDGTGDPVLGEQLSGTCDDEQEQDGPGPLEMFFHHKTV